MKVLSNYKYSKLTKNYDKHDGQYKPSDYDEYVKKMFENLAGVF